MPKFIYINGKKVRVWTDEEYVQANCRALNNAGIPGFHDKAFTLDDLKSAHTEGYKEGEKFSAALYGEALKAGHTAGFTEGLAFGKESGKQETLETLQEKLAAAYVEGLNESSKRFEQKLEKAKSEAYKEGLNQAEEYKVTQRVKNLKLHQFISYRTTDLRAKFFNSQPKTIRFPNKARMLAGIALGAGAFSAGIFAKKSFSQTSHQTNKKAI